MKEEMRFLRDKLVHYVQLYIKWIEDDYFFDGKICVNRRSFLSFFLRGL